jgi:hypothetical protein
MLDSNAPGRLTARMTAGDYVAAGVYTGILCAGDTEASHRSGRGPSLHEPRGINGFSASAARGRARPVDHVRSSDVKPPARLTSG